LFHFPRAEYSEVNKENIDQFISDYINGNCIEGNLPKDDLWEDDDEEEEEDNFSNKD